MLLHMTSIRTEQGNTVELNMTIAAIRKLYLT
jgi:hypothetical protein